jgi:DNA ligase-1
VNNESRDWRDIKIIVFDAPYEADKIYAERLHILRKGTLLLFSSHFKGIPSDHPVLSVISTVQCKGKEHVDMFFKETCQHGGEGIVIRNPNSWYYARDSFFHKNVMTAFIHLIDFRQLKKPL